MEVKIKFTLDNAVTMSTGWIGLTDLDTVWESAWDRYALACPMRASRAAESGEWTLLVESLAIAFSVDCSASPHPEDYKTAELCQEFSGDDLTGIEDLHDLKGRIATLSERMLNDR